MSEKAPKTENLAGTQKINNSDRREIANKVATLPAGLAVYVNGEPCRLVQDTPVINAYMAQVGFEEYYRRTRAEHLLKGPLTNVALGLNISPSRPQELRDARTRCLYHRRFGSNLCR